MAICIYPETIPASNRSRFVVCSISAVGVTFSLFLLMHNLVKAPIGIRPEPAPSIPIAIYQAPEERPTITRKPLPERQELIQPERMDLLTDPTDHSVDLVTGFTPSIGNFKVDPPTTGHSGPRDGAANPLVRVEPRYPVDAARQGISGWVQLRFSVDETGSVTDVEVLAAEPATIFNREAMRALRRWKYQPKVVNGQTVKQTNLQVQLDFKLSAD